MLINIEQLEFIDNKLRKILCWLEIQTGQNYIITSLYRIRDNGNLDISLHETLPLRAIDLRCRSRSIGQKIVDFINNRWVYDLNRLFKQCAILHGKGDKLHIHIQVHPNTEWRL